MAFKWKNKTAKKETPAPVIETPAEIPAPAPDPIRDELAVISVKLEELTKMSASILEILTALTVEEEAEGEEIKEIKAEVKE